MALNANKVKSSGGGTRQEPLPVGGYPGRVWQVIDLGLQARPPYKGKEKEPAHMINITYELSDEFCVDEEGNEQEDKPRVVSESMPIYNLKAEKAKSTQRYMALDPEQVHGGDFSALVGSPCLINLVQNERDGTVYNNVASLSTLRKKEADKLPELVNPPRFLDLDEPDLEVFNALPEFIQDKIKEGLEFKGSKLDVLLGGEEAPEKEEEEPESGEW